MKRKGNGNKALLAILAPAALAVSLAAGMVGCAASTQDAQASQDQAAQAIESALENTSSENSAEAPNEAHMPGGGMAQDYQPGQTTDKGYTATDSGIAPADTLDASTAFTERDLEQTADTASATQLSLSDGEDTLITEEGVYVVSGTASDATITVDAADTAKVQIVLDGVSITNTDSPAIYVKSADKVFVTLESENTLTVSGEFTADGETNLDAVIFSKDDLCLNGAGSLTISSSEHGIVSKDDLKVTGGAYTISAPNGSGLRADDSVRIADGTFTIEAEDGIKAKNDEDNELGYVYIKDGDFDITTTDNGIQGYAFVWVDGGTFKLEGEECIEGTYIQINDGTFDIDARDDAINASIKSSVYTPTLEINGGTLTITMAQGDTDALDSNGYLYIKGGKVDITAQFPFDYAWGGSIDGGEVYVNGEQVTELYDAMMGGMGGPGGMGNPNGMGAPEGEDGQMPDGLTPPDGEMPADGGFGKGGTPPDGNFGGKGGTPPDGSFGGQRPERGAGGQATEQTDAA